jgi:hypothetical protein
LALNTLTQRLKYGEKIGRITYPPEWQLLDEKELRERRMAEQICTGNPRVGGGDYQGGLGGFLGDRDGDSSGKQRGTPGGRPGGSTVEATKHVHPKIAQVMRPVWAVHGPMVKLDYVLTTANVRREELPVWRPAIKGKRNMLCYGNVFGKCRFGRMCIFQHLNGKDLNDGFAAECTTKIKPGADYLAKQWPTKEEQAGDEEGRKRQRQA